MSIDFTSGGIDFSAGQQGQQGYNPTSQDLQSAVTQFQNTTGDPSQNFLPNLPTFTLGSDTQQPGEISSEVNPFDLAGQGAASIMPFLQQQIDSGIAKEHPIAGKPQGLEGQFDLIGSMTGGGGGYSATFNPTSLNPEIASMLEGTKYADMYDVGGPMEFNQSNIDDLAGQLSSTPSAYFDPNTEVNDLIKDNPEMMEFYNAAPRPDVVDVKVNTPLTREEMQEELMSAPREGLRGAIEQDYSDQYDIGGGFMADPPQENPDNPNFELGGSLSDQMGMTSKFMEEWAGPQISSMMGPDGDANLGIKQNDDGTFDVPAMMSNLFTPGNQLMDGIGAAVGGFDMPDWAPQGVAPDSGQFSGLAEGLQNVGQGPQLDIQNNMDNSLGFLQQFMPDMYPTE